MKITIDIPREDYDRIKSMPNAFDSLMSRAYEAIRNGKPIEKTCQNKESISIGKLKPGTTIKVGGIQAEILDTAYPDALDDRGVLCLAEDILFQKRFDVTGCNNWAASSLRGYLNGEYLRKIESNIGSNALMSFIRDLTSDDGMRDYCECIDKVSLISCDEYRRYRKYISDKSAFWLTLTPWSCLFGKSNYVRLVLSDGSFYYSYAYSENSGVVPVFLLNKNVKVEVVE